MKKFSTNEGEISYSVQGEGPRQFLLVHIPPLATNLQVGRVVGSGPWANLEVPTQLHSMISRFLDLC